MNDDDYFNDLLKNHTRDWSWTVDQAKLMDPKLSSMDIYNLLTQLQNDIRKDKDMAYSYGRGYYDDTRGYELATLVLEAYANGVSFEQLIKKNSTVRQYWYQIQSEKAARLKAMERDRARREKAAEARAIKAAAKKEAMTKLTKEELEAFGLINKKRTSKA